MSNEGIRFLCPATGVSCIVDCTGNEDGPYCKKIQSGGVIIDTEALAKDSVAMADALLAELGIGK